MPLINKDQTTIEEVEKAILRKLQVVGGFTKGRFKQLCLTPATGQWWVWLSEDCTPFQSLEEALKVYNRL